MRKYTNYEFNESLIKEKVPVNLKVIIIIPAYNELEILSTLNSLLKNDFSNDAAEVIIVINESEIVNKSISDFHQKQYKELLDWSQKNSLDNLKFYPIYVKNIDKNDAGAGMARKIGMDEALRRFGKINNLQGIISNLDADTLVANNYLSALVNESKKKNKIKAFSIYYEHPLNINITLANKNAIISYELHLRYYILMQKLLSLPFAYHTVGSAMAVKAYAYAEAFGMNKRQAGEDFYFLHKYINTGFFKNINSTSVFPSPRISDRVPFGTGKSLLKLMNSDESLLTYNYKSFDALSSLTINLEEIYNDFNNVSILLKNSIQEFLISKNFSKKYKELKTNTKNYTSFKKRFYRWFDAFTLMKYLHFTRDHYFPNIPIEKAIDFLFLKLNFKIEHDHETQLLILRKIDKEDFLS